MFDNNINIMLDKNTILIILGFFVGIMSCFMLKKGIEHTIMNLQRKPYVQGLILVFVSLSFLAIGILTVLTSHKIVGFFEQTPQQSVVVEKQK